MNKLMDREKYEQNLFPFRLHLCTCYMVYAATDCHFIILIIVIIVIRGIGKKLTTPALSLGCQWFVRWWFASE